MKHLLGFSRAEKPHTVPHSVGYDDVWSKTAAVSGRLAADQPRVQASRAVRIR
ncbi:MAG: hypothetical protein MI673_05630 [Thiotrichales bacterium]|nr:hypothetical protein [Thiotrichales bacterium]